MDELRAEMQRHLEILAPVLDLEALVAPSDGVANREVPQDGAAGDAGEYADAASMRSRMLGPASRTLETPRSLEVPVLIVRLPAAAGRRSILAPGRHPGGFRTKDHSASRRLTANAIAHRDRPPQPRPAAEARGTARRYRLPFLPPSPPRRAATAAIPPLQSPQDRPSSASPSHWIPCRLTAMPRGRLNRSSWQNQPADCGAAIASRSLPKPPIPKPPGHSPGPHDDVQQP